MPERLPPFASSKGSWTRDDTHHGLHRPSRQRARHRRLSRGPRCPDAGTRRGHHPRQRLLGRRRGARGSRHATRRVIRSAENLGFAAGHNRAIVLEPADAHLVLNPDCRLAPRFLEEAVGALEADSSARFRQRTTAQFPSRYPGRRAARGVRRRHPRLDRDGRAAESAGARPLGRATGHGPDLRDSDVFGASGAAAVYRRTMLEDVAFVVRSSTRRSSPTARTSTWLGEPSCSGGAVATCPPRWRVIAVASRPVGGGAFPAGSTDSRSPTAGG